MGKTSHFYGLEDGFQVYLFFLENNWDWAHAALPVDCVTFLQQCETSHKLSVAFEIQASNLTCIILEFLPRVFLAACPPAESGGAHLCSARAGGLSLHLQQSQSEKSRTWTKPSRYLNLASSYLVSSISTRQDFRGTCCCYFILLGSYLVLCLFQAGCDPDQGQSK